MALLLVSTEALGYASSTANDDRSIRSVVFTGHTGLSSVAFKQFISVTHRVKVGRIMHEEVIQALGGATPNEVLESMFPVVHGFVCSSDKDVLEIAGIRGDPKEGLAWVLSINGDRVNSSPHSSILMDGDIVEWELINVD